MTAPFPPRKIPHLTALRDLKVVETSPEPAFDDLARIAAWICDAPIAGISLVNERSQRFVSYVGLPVAESPHEMEFCAHALLSDDVLLVPDASKDPRFAHNPLVISGPRIRLFAGAPLVSQNGHTLGAVCIMDTSPRELEAKQVEALRVLSRQAAALMELREALRDATTNAVGRTRAEAALRDSEEVTKSLFDNAPMTMGLVEDVTDRKAAENELVEARDKALAACREKSAFLMAMNHELRTPLNAIIGYAELLEEEMSVPEFMVFLRDVVRIKAAAKSLLGTIDNILDVSRFELNKVMLRPEKIDVERMLLELREAAAPHAEKAGCSLEIRCDPGVGAIVADPVRLRRCLENLLKNAAQFTQRGSITLSAERAREGERGLIRFAVADTGIGIDPNMVEQLMDEFSQADVAASRKYGGTGLGLTISRRLCRLMGGSIHVSSEVGQGSTFTITLPTTEDPIR